MSLNAYFQAWPEDDKTKQWPVAPAGMIANPEHYEAILSDLVADSACLLVLWPNHGAWLGICRNLQRMYQCKVYGRAMSESERNEVDHALRNMPVIPPGALGNLPRFAEEFAARVRQTHDFFTGRRVSSRAAFDELLRLALDESRKIQAGNNWEDDRAPRAAIDRQLRAMQRWTARGRSPSREEREGTREALAVVSRLRGLDTNKEWATRIEELSAAFYEGLQSDVGEAPLQNASEIGSLDEFGLLLDDTHRDCRSLSGRKLLSQPKGPPVVWEELAGNIDPVRRMVEKGRVPSQRERAEIHRALTTFDGAIANPCPAIHDFLEEMTDRLARIDAYYTWLVTEGKFAGQETGSIDASSVHCMTLGGEMRVAFVRSSSPDPGLYVCVSEKAVTSERTGAGIEYDFMRYQPTTKNLIQLVACKGWAPSEIRWNAHSDWLAYLIPGKSPSVAWAETRKPGERGRVSAAAFAWATKGSNLIALDIVSRSVFRVNADTGKKKPLVSLPDDVQPPALRLTWTIAPGGDIMAADVWPQRRADRSLADRLRRRSPGRERSQDVYCVSGGAILVTQRRDRLPGHHRQGF